ncbi:MAG: redox-sensing transcriptional repressor Rex [Chitinispirillaceae bacterium]|jgi:redox-sensing transcriptional repressor
MLVFKGLMAAKKNCILRLSRYKNELYRFKKLGFIKIFSEYLAEAVGVTSAQVRKDFSLFDISGNKRGGYTIDAILDKLNAILGKNQIQKVVVVGAGNLGSALLRYKNFEKQGIRITAAFDIDPAKGLQKFSTPVHPMTDLESFLRGNEIKIGILCVPEVAAQSVFDAMVRAGIRGVLNFSPIQLKTPVDCIVTNVNLEVELENLIYFVTAGNSTK